MAEFLNEGNPVLGPISLQIFKNYNGFPVAPSQGDVLYFNGTKWVSLPAGTSGQSLTTQGAGANPKWSSASVKYGGDGSDGALSVASGITTIDLGGAAYVVKNYSSISITGTGKVVFINPNANGTTIIFKSQGACTITSSTVPAIDVSGLGAAGGAGGTGVNVGGNLASAAGGGGANLSTGGGSGAAGGSGAGGGNSGAAGSASLSFISIPGGGGGYPSGGGSTTIAGGSLSTYYSYASKLANKSILLAPGSGGGGGGGGSSGSPSGGSGGAGGGALYMEIAGALNFTGTINANGANGGAGTSSTTPTGGGGGGGAGCVIILYGTLTANTGTINVNGGTGGVGGPVGGNGAAGISMVAKNTEFA